MSIEEIIKSTKTIAIIGCSSKYYRTSYQIAKYLDDSGFTIIPVNPNEDSVLGHTCYPQLSEIPDDIEIDMIDIFRNSRYAAEMVEEVIDWADETGQKPVIWTQLGVSSEEAKSLAEENGFTYIEDKCLMVEHRKLS